MVQVGAISGSLYNVSSRASGYLHSPTAQNSLSFADDFIQGVFVPGWPPNSLAGYFGAWTGMQISEKDND